MLTNKTRQLYGRLINIAFFCGNSPFLWSPKTKQVSVITGELKWGWVLFVQFCIQVYVTYLIVTIGRELFFREEPRLSEIPLAFGSLLIIICVDIITYNLLSQADDISYFTNSFLYFCNHLEERFGPITKKERKLISHLPNVLRLCCMTILVLTTLFAVYFIYNPNDKMFGTSMIDDPLLQLAAQIVLLPSCICFAVGGTLTLTLTLFSLCLPLLVAHELGKEIAPRSKLTKCRWMRIIFHREHGLSRPSTIILFSRTLSIYIILINNIISPLLFIFQNVISFCIIVCTFCLISFHQILNLNALFIITGLAVLSLGGWVTTLWFAGTSFKVSSRKINSLIRSDTFPRFGSPEERKVFKMVLKSTRPVQIKAGHFYVIKIPRTLAFINFVIWATTKALLLLK